MCYKLKDMEIKKMSCGWEHSIVITKEKKCFSWGINESGQCGVGPGPIIFNPTQILNLESVKEVSCGNEHSLALLENGDLYSWGQSQGGLLGFKGQEFEYYPKKVTELRHIDSISCGSLHSVALKREGGVYSWGCGEGGQLGQPEGFLISTEEPGSLVKPTLIESLNHMKIKKVSSGEAHSLALTNDGKVYGWGFTSNGQLGLGIFK
jgi:alpha-tubulin suppressor-like RCC1 family protein